LVDHRVRTTERVREWDVGPLNAAEDGTHLFQPVDGFPRPALDEGQLPEPAERPRPLVARRRPLEDLVEEFPGELALVESKRDLGLDERRAFLVALVAGGEVVLADTEPLSHLSQQLQRRDSVARFDPRDVRRRAAREGELSLT